MSNTVKKLIAFALTACLTLAAAPTANAAEAEAPAPAYFDLPVTVDTIRVGLNFGSSALYEAKLLNSVGSGYLFGYFDYSRQFHELGKTEVTALSMRGDNGFTLPDGMVVGPWHMVLNKQFKDFDSAKEFASALWGGFPGYIDGEYKVLVGAYADEAKTLTAIKSRSLDAKPFTGSKYSILAAETDTSELQFLLDVGEGTNLAVRPVSSSEKAETWFAGNAYHGDFQYVRTGSSLTVINYVDLEDYVMGVLPYEMHGDWPQEALKAQGTCARTYAMNNINAYIDRGFDVRNDTYSQVYRGVTGTTESTNMAAAATAGEYVRYRGSVCKVYYMSSDGGATDSSANVFSQKRAYLSGVKDDNEKNIEYYNKSWKTELYDANVLYRLALSDYELDDIANIKATKSDMGNVIQLVFNDTNGKTVTLLGEDCFRIMGFNSLRYNVTSYENEQGERIWVFKGNGWGHNCGMSQWGAYAMALNKNASSKEIIDFYFSGAYLG